MKRFFFIGMASLFFSGCGGLPTEIFNDLPQRQPVVSSINPPDGTIGFENNVIEVRLSQPVDTKTITAKSFVVTPLSVGEPNVHQLWEDVVDEEIKGAEGSYDISNEGTTIRFIASKNFDTAGRWGVLLTPEILSLEHIPFNQTPGTGPTPFFSSFYSKGIFLSSQAGENVSPPNLRPAYLYLNEIFYDAVGADADADLFVELYGEPFKEIGGYQLVMINGSDGKTLGTVKIPAGSTIAEDGLFVVANKKNAAADWVTPLDPPNGPDCLRLLNEAGKLVDEIGYGSPSVCYQGTPAPDAPSGKSIVRKNKGEWIVLDIPTPGFLDFKENF